MTMRTLRNLLVAALALVGGVASVHAETFGAERYAPDAFTVPVDNYVGYTDHADDGVRGGVSADTSSVLRLRAGPLLGLAAGALLLAHGDAELGALVATAPVAAPEAVTKALDELKGNIKRVLDLEDQIEQGVAAGKAVADLKEQVQTISTKNAELIDTAKTEMAKAQTERLDEIETELTKRFGAGGLGARTTAGKAFVESEAFKNAPDRARMGSGVVVDRPNTKDVTTSSNQNPPLYTGEVVRPQNVRLAMRNIIPVGRSARDVIKYAKLTGRATAAAQVAAGALKPESALVFADAQANMVKLAHYIPVTEEQLSDIDGLQSIIDSELEYGIEKAEDSYILNDGADGLIANATVYDKATYGDTVVDPGDDAGTALIIQIRGGVAQLEVADYAPTGLVLNPIEWFKIETSKTGDGAFRFVNPQSRATARLWGLDVVATNQIAATDFLVGDFSMAAMLYDGQLQDVYGIQLKTGQPNDYFLRNLYAVLAEERVALTVKRPGAMVYYDSDAL